MYAQTSSCTLKLHHVRSNFIMYAQTSSCTLNLHHVRSNFIMYAQTSSCTLKIERLKSQITGILIKFLHIKMLIIVKIRYESMTRISYFTFIFCSYTIVYVTTRVKSWNRDLNWFRIKFQHTGF